MPANSESSESLLPGSQPARSSLCPYVAERARFPVWFLMQENRSHSHGLWPYDLTAPQRSRPQMSPRRGCHRVDQGRAQTFSPQRCLCRGMSLPACSFPRLAFLALAPSASCPRNAAPGPPTQTRLSTLSSSFLSSQSCESSSLSCSSSPNEKSVYLQSQKTFYDLILLSLYLRSCASIPNVFYFSHSFSI